MNRLKKFYIVLAIICPLLLITAFLMKDFFIELSKEFPQCISQRILGFNCPGCGNTRSVLYLLKGELLNSLRCNIAPLLLLTLLILLYIEMIFSIFGKNVKLLPRKLPFWLSVIGIITVYYIARNFIGFLAPIP